MEARGEAARLLDEAVSILERMQREKTIYRDETAVDAHASRIIDIVLHPALEPFRGRCVTRTTRFMMGGSGTFTFRLVAKTKIPYDTDNEHGYEQLVVFPDGGTPQHDISMRGYSPCGWSRGNETSGWFKNKIAQLRALQAIITTDFQ